MKAIPVLFFLVVGSLSGFSQTTGEMKADASRAYDVSDNGSLNMLTQERTKRLREDLERFRDL